MDDQGWGIGCAVGLSARDASDSGLVWFLPRRKPLCTIVSADLIGVDLNGKVVHATDRECGLLLSSLLTPDDPEHVHLHLAIYRARPDINGISSGHTPHGKAFSAKGETIKMLWQDSCFFAGRVPVLPFEAGVNARSNPQAVVDALGDKKGFIMAGRGLLMTAATIEGAMATYIRLENLCGNQMLVEAAVKGRGGDMIEIGEEEVKVSSYRMSG